MIRADDDSDLSDFVDADVDKQELVETVLTEEEQALLYSLDADVESAAAMRRPGKMFEVRIAREVSASVLSRLKHEWESGGWTVGVFEIADPKTGRPVRERAGYDDEFVFRLVLARPHRQQTLGRSGRVSEALAARQAEEFVVPDEATIERLVSGGVRTTTPLLVRMPTRARPQQALEVLAKYRDMAIGHVAIEVVIDEDDRLSNNTQFLQRLAELDCTVTVGRHKSKIEACNAGRVCDWGVLVLASDDMVPVMRGYDQRILAAFEKHFPLLDGAICFDDGYNKDHVREGEPVTCTLPVLGRHVFEEVLGGYVYHPEYRSIFCDTDQTFLLNNMKRMVFVDEIVVEHRHFANSKATFDELYKHNSRHDEHDQKLFEERRAAEFNAPQMELSILICSVAPRRQQLERLVNYLRWQMTEAVDLRFERQCVEICVDTDDHVTVGEKRQRLLERAVGKYVCFIDDDDWVDSRYIERVLKACAEGKDCCSLTGVITEDGANPRRFEHSLAHDGWYTREDGVFIRTPNHLNTVRRELALEVGFVSQNVGEDHDFSNRIQPLLKSEASTGDASLYFYWNVPTKSVQGGGAK
ncbi:MAG: glycosyltransferase [Gemmatimonadota bacterium]